MFRRDPKSGSIILEDNQSKFGTLVQLRAPLILAEHVTYYLQAGRTIMKVIAQPEWSFFSSLMWGISRSSSETNRAGQEVPALTAAAALENNKLS